MKLKAKDLKVGMRVVIHECGERYVYTLTRVEHYPQIAPTYGSAFIALGTAEWPNGVPRLNSTLNLDEEVEIEL
jgi:hypothetical protein